MTEENAEDPLASGDFQPLTCPKRNVLFGDCTSFLKNLDNMRKNAVLTDMFITDMNGKSMEVHSCVLAAGCHILQNTLALEQSQYFLKEHGLSLTIDGLPLNVWDKLLTFMYMYEANMDDLGDVSVQDFYDAARMLHMDDLENLVLKYCRSNDLELHQLPVKAVNITLSPVVGSTSKVESNVPVKAELLDQENLEAEPLSPASEDKIGLWSCHICDHAFTNKRDLMVHRETQCEREEDAMNDMDGLDDLAGDDGSEIEHTTIIGSASNGKNIIAPLTCGEYICFNIGCARSFSSRKAYTQHLLECICTDDSVNISDYLRITEKGMIYDDHKPHSDLPEDAVACPTANFTMLDPKTRYDAVGIERYQHFQCSHCSFRSNRVRMGQHLAVLHGRRQPFACRVCKQRYSYFDSVRDHYLSSHTQVSLMCEECDAVFHKKDSLRRHRLMVHKNKNGTPYKCNGCGKGFKWPHHARRHERYHQRHSARPFPCTTCSKTFATKQDLDRHLTVHFPSNQYSCRLCTYTTSRKFNLTTHERAKHHINRGSLLCITCNKCFVSETRFQSHLKTHHHMGVIMNKDEDAAIPIIDKTGEPGEEDDGDDDDEEMEEDEGGPEEKHSPTENAGSSSFLPQNSVHLVDFGNGMMQLVPVNGEGGDGYDLTSVQPRDGFELNPVTHGDDFGEGMINKNQNDFEAMADGKTLIVYGIPTDNE